MKDTIMKALFFWLLLVMIIQPALSQRDYLLNLITKSNASYLAEKAAVQGRITPALATEVRNNLKATGFIDSDIEILGDMTLKSRGSNIEVIIRIKRPSMYYLTKGLIGVPSYYYGKSNISSEYIP